MQHQDILGNSKCHQREALASASDLHETYNPQTFNASLSNFFSQPDFSSFKKDQLPADQSESEENRVHSVLTIQLFVYDEVSRYSLVRQLRDSRDSQLLMLHLLTNT